jgi:hypothetical protein
MPGDAAGRRRAGRRLQLRQRLDRRGDLAQGKLVAGPRPDGSTWGQMNPDGSITAKVGWYRAIEGGLRVSGERLAAAVPAGY